MHRLYSPTVLRRLIKSYMKKHVCINHNTQMLEKGAPLFLINKTAIFSLQLVFVWLLLIMTNASIVYAQFLSIPTTTFQQPFQYVSPPPVTPFQQPSTTFQSQFGGPGAGFPPPSTTIFQPSYTLPPARWLVLLPASPSSSVIQTGITSQWFPSSILLSQKPNQQQFDFERWQQQLIQNGIQKQQSQQLLQQQQQIGTNEQQQTGASYLLGSSVNSNDHQIQTTNNENRQCTNNTCTNQVTQCTNGVCTTTTTNDNGSTQVNTQVCNIGSNSASFSCSVRQIQTAQCTGNGVCTITQTECINGICITRFSTSTSTAS